MEPFSLSPAYCREQEVCVVEDTSEVLAVGMVNPDDTTLKEKLLRAFGEAEGGGKRSLRFVPVSRETWVAAVTACLAKGKNASASDLLNGIVAEALRRNASDIHFERGRDTVRVRFRVDGVLEVFAQYQAHDMDRVVYRLKLLSALDTEETRHPQDGRFLWSEAGLSCDVRLSCIPAWNGESVVLRLLHTRGLPLAVERLGFSEPHQKTLKRLVQETSSLVLVCGPTGAGKTTTLVSLLETVSGGVRKIVTIEDPVEYELPFVTQIEADAEQGNTFDALLSRVFRHDPDILMVGEIRDEKTARVAVRAALTGHLVFATVHTTDAPTAVLRLLDMGIEPYLLASVFGAAVAQALVPKIGGGRTVVAEILEGTDAVRRCIHGRGSLAELRSAMEEGGMVSLKQDYQVKRLLGVCA